MWSATGPEEAGAEQGLRSDNVSVTTSDADGRSGRGRAHLHLIPVSLVSVTNRLVDLNPP
ncbi:unnamed protein product [Ectocarpus sp. CCAP 1310/34]|nr:unnamed protein product [Ectocarpus sp. CCAP 1310/34]CAB1119558.1 unnamed protein product [Ectocarpus sp. CCAP 1310/34]